MATQGALAKELVFIFYDRTGLKYTNKDIMIAVKNAKVLLQSGYTYEEVRDTIEYCVLNPPKNGIYSFGFIVSQINKVTTMLKNTNKKFIETKAMDKSKFNDYGLTNVSNRDKIKLKESETKINIFDDNN